MSRVGKQLITLPAKVAVKIGSDRSVLVEGPKGKLTWTLPAGFEVNVDGTTITVTRLDEERRTRAIHGVGFRASVKGTNLDLSLGQSHPRLHPIPAGLKVTVAENTKIAVEGIDKQLVGQFAADVRSYYPPEPYKGKGVRYTGEHIRRKAGKSVK